VIFRYRGFTFICTDQWSDSMGVPTFAHEGVLLHQWRIRDPKLAYPSAGSSQGQKSFLAALPSLQWILLVRFTFQIKYININGLVASRAVWS
jgi:hypothetical protein